MWGFENFKKSLRTESPYPCFSFLVKVEQCLLHPYSPFNLFSFFILRNFGTIVDFVKMVYLKSKLGIFTKHNAVGRNDTSESMDSSMKFNWICILCQEFTSLLDLEFYVEFKGDEKV